VRDEKGNVRTINTAQTLFQRQSMDKIMSQAQEAAKMQETQTHDRASEKAQMITANASAQNANTNAQRFNMEKDQFKKQTPQGQFAMIKEMIGDMTPEEEKSIKMKLVGIGKGKGDDTDEKLAEEVTKKWAENNPTATPEQVANFNGKLKASFTTFKQNSAVESAASKELTAAKGTPTYESKYREAVSLGISPDRLKAMGFSAPVVNDAKSAATLGTARTVNTPAEQNGVADVRNDPILQSINASLSKLDANDPRNTQALMALGKAKNDRLAQLQEANGRLTTLIQ
jgi:hypothetical protein